jgi:hypothetical protein
MLCHAALSEGTHRHLAHFAPPFSPIAYPRLYQWTVFYDLVNKTFHLKFLGRLLGITNFFVSVLGLIVFPAQNLAMHPSGDQSPSAKVHRFFLVNVVLTGLEAACVVFPFMLLVSHRMSITDGRGASFSEETSD